MKTKLVCIAISIFFGGILTAQKINIYRTLRQYDNCDTASFIKTCYSKFPEKSTVGIGSYAMTISRKSEGAFWHSYNMNTLDTSNLFLSFFDASTKKIYLADTDNVYREISNYEFYTLQAPPYIWDNLYSPWDQRLRLKNVYKRNKIENGFHIYSSKYGINKMKLYVNPKNNLIERIVSVQSDGGYDSVIYHYNYFKNPTYEYISHGPKNRYFPVNNKNESILLEMKRKDINQKTWNNRIIIMDTVLSKIINGKYDYYLLDFWYLTCHPCKVNLKVLDTSMKKIKNMEVVIINVHDSDMEVRNYLNKNSLTFRNICDYNHDIEGYFKPTAYPTTILLDQKGKVLWRHDGIATDIGNQIQLVIQSRSASEK